MSRPPHAKLQALLQVILYLQSDRASLAQLSQRFDVSERTMDRYINTLETVGIPVDQDFNKKYFIADLTSFFRCRKKFA